MKNIIFSAKFTLTPLGVTLVYEGGTTNFPETFCWVFELGLTFAFCQYL